jgi:hypothetical protein
MNSCSKDDATLSSQDAGSACSGGSAHMCHSLTPWKVNDSLSYGYAATPSRDTCGKCYELQFTGATHNAGNDPGAAALKDKRMIVQAINTGYDVAGHQFDIAIPGGGVGAFDACSSQWGTTKDKLGDQYGGVLGPCKRAGGDVKACVRAKCDEIFKSKGLDELYQGCMWFVDWYQAADNPSVNYREVACPSDLVNRSGMNTTKSPTSSCGN